MTKRFVRKRGYALVMCLLVIAVSSSIVLTLFNMLRLQTAEFRARRQLTVANLLVDAAREHAVSVLIDQPTFRGPIGPVSIPQQPGNQYYIEISDASGDMLLTVVGSADKSSTSGTYLITAAALAKRRAAIGL